VWPRRVAPSRLHSARPRRATLIVLHALARPETTAATAAICGNAASARTSSFRFQQPFFPEGIAFYGNGFVRTAVTAPVVSNLRPIEGANEGVVDQNSASWNRLASWLQVVDALRRPA
jgi:hypothetical protein